MGVSTGMLGVEWNVECFESLADFFEQIGFAGVQFSWYSAIEMLT